jgi:uncharacterized protein YkwD
MLLSLPTDADCLPEGRAGVLGEMLAAHQAQQRVAMTCDPRLVAFAKARAADMAARGYFGHVNPDNIGPNELLVATGFLLPNTYSGGRNNNIESIVGGLPRPSEVLEALLGSTRHRPQVLGENPFFQSQDRFGVAYIYAPQTPQVDIWVVVFAREANPDEPDLNCTPPPGECFLRSRSQ